MTTQRTLAVMVGGEEVFKTVITGDVTLSVAESDDPAPTPGPSPVPPGAFVRMKCDPSPSWINYMNVREKPTTSSPIVDEIPRGAIVEIDSDDIWDVGDYRWRRIFTESAQYVAEYKTDRNGKVIERYFIALDPTTPTPTPTPPPTGATPARTKLARFTNGAFGISIDNKAPKRLLGASLDRMYAFPQENALVSGWSDRDYWGDPNAPDNRTFGMLRNLSLAMGGFPTIVRYFSYYRAPDPDTILTVDRKYYASHDLSWDDLIKRNVKFLDQCQEFGLLGMPVLNDGLNTVSAIRGDEQFRTRGPYRHFNGDYWITNRWRARYFDWLDELIKAIRTHPAFAGVILANEYQVFTEDRNRIEVKQGFMRWAKESSERVKGLTSGLVGLGVINAGHAWGDGSAAFARELYQSLPAVDLVTVNAHQNNGTSTTALWDNESPVDAQVAHETDKAFTTFEWTPNPVLSWGDQVTSVKNMAIRNYGVYRAAFTGIWALDYSTVETGNGGGSMTPYKNPAFAEIRRNLAELDIQNL